MAAYRLFKQMLVEEWRFHSNLFGSIRFGLFPFVILSIVSVGAWFLTYTTVNPQQVVIGIHGVVFLFGIQTGSVSFEGGEAIANVLGDVTYLSYSFRTHPISKQVLLTTYYAKDMLYYSVLFVLPITIGLYPLFSLTELVLSPVVFTSLFFSMGSAFIWGSSVGVIGVNIEDDISKYLSLIVLLGFIAMAGVDPAIAVSLTPLGIYNPSSIVDIIIPVCVLVASAILSVRSYSPSQTQTVNDMSGSYDSIKSIIPVRDPISAKIILEIYRSNGGIAKIGFVSTVLALIIGVLIWGSQTLLESHINEIVIFGALSSLISYTIYEQTSQYDSVSEYLFLPVSVKRVFRAKYIVFLLFLLPTQTVLFVGALAYYSPSLLNAFVGIVAGFCLSIYMYGVTVFNNGAGSGEFMFDTVSFSLFAVAFLVGVGPLLFLSLVSNPIIQVVAIVIMWCVLLAGFGVVLSEYSSKYWQKHYV